MSLNLIDNRFVFINNVRFDRLLFAIKTIGQVAKYMYTDVLYPKFGPAITALYANIKSYTDALADAITDRIASLDAKKLGESLAKFIKSGLVYVKDVLSQTNLNINFLNNLDIKDMASSILAALKGIGSEIGRAHV